MRNRSLGTHRRQGQPAVPRRHDVRRLRQPRPRRLRPDHPPGARRRASTSSTPPTCTRRASPRRSSARRWRAGATTSILATKFHGPMGDDPNQRGNSRRWIVREVENSLRRLGTDYIDLYQVHRPDLSHATSTTRCPRCPTSCTRARSATSARRRSRPRRSSRPSGSPRSGATSGSASSSRRTRSSCAASRRRCCRPARRYGMGVIPWSPLNGGFLTGRYRPGEAAPPERAGGPHARPLRSRPPRCPAQARADPRAREGRRARPACRSPTWRSASRWPTRRSARRSSGRARWTSSRDCSARATSRSTTTRSTPSTSWSRPAPTSTEATRAGPHRRSPRPGVAGGRSVVASDTLRSGCALAGPRVQ